MTLKFTLKPGERFVANGALFQNGDRKTALMLHNHAWLLRDREFLSSAEAATAAGRRYTRILQLLMQPGGPGDSLEEISRIFVSFIGEIDDPETLLVCRECLAMWQAGDYYAALRKFRPLCAAPETQPAPTATRASG